MSTLEVYGIEMSPPCRAVLITCDMIGKQYELKTVDITKGDHQTPEYLAMNPQHTIPCIRDGDFVLSESRAIACYIVDCYAQDDKLYPRDPKVRAQVDHRLYFDIGTLMKSLASVMYPLLFLQSKAEEKDYEKLNEALGWINDFVRPTGYVAGTGHPTVADVSLVPTITNISRLQIVDLSVYADLTAWLERMKAAIPNYEKTNGVGLEEYAKVATSMMQGKEI